LIRVAITAEACDAIAATLPLGSVGYEEQITANGDRWIWLEKRWISKLAALRGPGENWPNRRALEIYPTNVDH
jgi:hypothetical protein